MKTRKALFTIVVMILTGSFAFGQASAGNPVSPGEPVAAQIGVDTAQQDLKEVSVDKFEDPGFWNVSMPLDEGLIMERGLPGAPANRKPIPEEQKLGINEQDNTVLGVKVTFFRRGFERFAITPTHPIPVEGIVKTVSVWVVGRNTNHILSLIVEDQAGQVAELPFGTLNFTGWRQLTVAIPPGLVQQDYHYGDRSGLKIDGFVVDTAPLEAFGTFYIYFDDMTAVTDLFGEEKRSSDDMSDAW